MEQELKESPAKLRLSHLLLGTSPQNLPASLLLLRDLLLWKGSRWWLWRWVLTEQLPPNLFFFFFFFIFLLQYYDDISLFFFFIYLFIFFSLLAGIHMPLVFFFFFCSEFCHTLK